MDVRVGCLPQILMCVCYGGGVGGCGEMNRALYFSAGTCLPSNSFISSG